MAMLASGSLDDINRAERKRFRHDVLVKTELMAHRTLQVGNLAAFNGRSDDTFRKFFAGAEIPGDCCG
jgi:hypothetical protein